MMWQGGIIHVIIVAFFVQGVKPTSDVCRNAVAPASKPRGVNQVDRASNTPLFELHVTPVQSKGKTNGPSPYKITVSTDDGKPLRFTEALLAVTTDGSCGSGEFEFNPYDFVEVVQDHSAECPRLVQTNRKSHMTELMPLLWMPPSCGCIQFRVLIVESGEVYYAENEGVTSGPLVKTICSHRSPKISRDQRLDSLCHVVDKHSSSEIMSRSQFQRRRAIEVKWMDHLGLEMALELRRSDVKICCNMDRHETRMVCFDNARRRRIDQFCEDGIPDVPFRTFRRRHMRNLEKSCCYILGEFRYQCFAKESQLAEEAAAQDTTVFDYSMDASDVVNDLADFGSHEFLDMQLRPRKFGDNEDYDDDYMGDETKERDIAQETPQGDDTEEDEDNDEIEEDLVPTHQAKYTPKKKAVLQRAPSKRRKDVHKKSSVSSTSFSTDRDVSPPKSASRGIERHMKKLSKRRNSLRSGTGKGSRRLNRRKQQRGKFEKRKKMRKTSSGIDRASRRGWEGKDRTFYQPRSERGNSQQREFDSQGHKRRRQPNNTKKNQNLPSQYDIEDQGGSSMDKTLRKLKKKMIRLQLRKICCEAGVQIGREVYGGIGQVKDECRHSSVKYVRSADLPTGTRKCADQFVECCLEEAKKGLTMTSQEFIENSMANYWDNDRGYDPQLVGRVLSQRGRHIPYTDRRSRTSTRKEKFQARPKTINEQDNPTDGAFYLDEQRKPDQSRVETGVSNTFEKSTDRKQQSGHTDNVRESSQPDNRFEKVPNTNIPQPKSPDMSKKMGPRQIKADKKLEPTIASPALNAAEIPKASDIPVNEQSKSQKLPTLQDTLPSSEPRTEDTSMLRQPRKPSKNVKTVGNVQSRQNNKSPQKHVRKVLSQQDYAYPNSDISRRSRQFSNDGENDKRFTSMRKEISVEDFQDGYFGPRRFDDIDNNNLNQNYYGMLGDDLDDLDVTDDIDEYTDDRQFYNGDEADNVDDDNQNYDGLDDQEGREVNQDSDDEEVIDDDDSTDFDEEIEDTSVRNGKRNQGEGNVLTRQGNMEENGAAEKEDSNRGKMINKGNAIEDKFLTASHHKQEILEQRLESRVPGTKSDRTRARIASENQNQNAKRINPRAGSRQQKRTNRKTHSSHSSRRRYRGSPSSPRKAEALDSREMAERNSRKLVVAMDSREMADQYNRKSTWFGRKTYRRARRLLRRGRG